MSDTYETETLPAVLEAIAEASDSAITINALTHAASLLRNRRAGNGGWVKCSDRLPECKRTPEGFWLNVPVTICYRGNHVTGAFYNGEHQCFHTDEGLPYPDVTHWQPMPLPPKPEVPRE